MRRFIVDLAGPLDNLSKTRPRDQRIHAERGGEHAGLLLQRYACEETTGGKANPEEKRALMTAAIRAAEKSSMIYRSAYQRWEQSFDETIGTITYRRIVETDGRVVVGLGTENVLETGIRLHHTYGMPVLPGSALKGMAAHYCHQVWGDTDSQYQDGNALHKLLFGATDDSGCIRFLDAWLTPDSASPLRADVMTPHHPKWLDGSVPPSDFDAPIPIPFLSVAGKFQVAVQWQGPESEHARDWTQRALDLVLQALCEWGIGGKTSSGYGRLVDPTQLNVGQTQQAGNAKTTAPNRKLPKSGEEVTAVLSPEKTNKLGWKAHHLESDLTGPIQNTADVPEEKEAGQELVLIVAFASERSIAFRYPTAAELARKAKGAGRDMGDRAGKKGKGGRRR